MQMMLTILVAGILTDNFVLAQFLGYLSISRRF